MYSGPLRLLRALTVSATCVALSLAAHFLGTGSTAPGVSLAAVVGLLMTTLLLTLVLATLSGQRWTLRRSLVAIALGQVALNAVFTVLLSSHEHQGPAAFAGGASMVLAHAGAAVLVGAGIAVNDSALDTYFSLTSSAVYSGIVLLSPWRLAALISIVASVLAVVAAGRGERFARWQRPRILTGLVLLQCLSRRGPPAFALAS